jgi:predicted  nucleic acid-binding Zn-ribbon protein
MFLGVSLVLWSCKDGAREGYLSEIASMEQELDSMMVIAQANRIDTLPKLIDHIKNRTLEVSNLYAPDTIDLEIAKMMNLYRDVRKAMSSNSGNLAKVKNSIPEVQQKLADLRYDIENGLGDREKYGDFVNFERSKVNQIKEILNYYLDVKQEFTDVFNETDPQVRAFIQELRNE